MKILYITLCDFKYGVADGVIKKIQQHIKVLEDSGMHVDFTSYNRANNIVYLNETSVLGICKGMIKGSYAKKIILEYLKNNKYDGIYFRHGGRIDRYTIQILKEEKKKGSKIVYEIPTFPYDGQCRGIKDQIDLMIDRIYRKKLKNCVNKIAAFSTNDKIYGVDAIYLKNGINIDSIKFEEKKEIDEIHMIALGKFSISHGYDRMIHAFNKYYNSDISNKRKIFFHLVGEGTESKCYKELVEKFGLEDKIIFYGMQSGNKLDEIFKKCNIAVDCLGLYRFGLDKVSSLKSLEYLARGFPIIYAGILNKEEVESNIWYQIPNNDEEINIIDIVKFFDNIYKDLNINIKIHEFAKSKYDIKIVFKSVVDFFADM